jgi:hypothetical protein
MFSKEFLEILVEIVKSWQVIAVTIAMLIYLNIVSYVARSYHRPKVKRVKIKKEKAAAAAPVDAGPAVTDEGEGDSNEDLGLEEA